MTLTLEASVVLALLSAAVTGGVAWGLVRGKLLELTEWKRKHEVEYQQALRDHVTHGDLAEFHRRSVVLELQSVELGRDLKALYVSVVGMSGRNGLTGELREVSAKIDKLLDERPWHRSLSRFTQAHSEKELDVLTRLEALEARVGESET